MSLDIPTIEEFVATMKMAKASNIQNGNGRANELTGTDDADILFGKGGNDRLDGGDGEDQLFGGAGPDYLSGGDGSDLIEDLKGSNTVDAGEGDDYVVTGSGKDTIDAGDDDDIILSGGGRDVVYGGDGDDIIDGGRGKDSLFGDDGDDLIYGNRGRDHLDGGMGDDQLFGGNGADVIYSQFGNDVMDGGRGDDLLESRSDSGEPIIAQAPDMPRYYPDNPIDDADDVMTGGRGADEFRFRLDIDAKLAIAQKHADENGVINWRDVAGENNNPHDHWVNGIGNDRITDFNREEGDTIVVTGHTVQTAVENIDLDDDGIMESSRLTLYSDQGNNGGAHNQDKLGTVIVENALLTDADIVRDEQQVFYGAHVTIDDLMMA